MFDEGKFFVGCNYWASHAGTAMWSDWKPDIVENDFERLSDHRIKVLRVFPLWPDFQPIYLLRKGFGRPAEYRFGEAPLSDDEEGRAGVSKAAMARFQQLADLAEKYGLQLIVGLITGWMSGRLFVPPALEGKNVLTDPVAIQWEIRFVKYFVNRFKRDKSIVAWDLGNECNCMADVKTEEEAWIWASAITGAIRSADQSRPVISGMHSLTPDGTWTMRDQGEITDILTTHPYPYFTPHCDQDPINTIRTELHAVSETLFYRGIGGKPCMVEEIGTLGPMFAGDEEGASFIRANLFNGWSHDCLGLLWWCANEQSKLTHAPYDWNAVERELGLFTADGTPKPVLKELEQFARFTDKLPFEALPPRITDGVCILTPGQDTWGAAYSAFVLAKQAGLDLEYQYSDQPIRDAGLYFLPSMKGDNCISLRRMKELLEKVYQGAALYMSMDTGLLSPFSEFSGLKIHSRQKARELDRISFSFEGQAVALPLKGAYRFNLEAITARIIGEDQNGLPAFTVADYGNGKVFFLNYPVETYLLSQPGIFDDGQAPYYLIYKRVAHEKRSGKIVSKEAPNLGITEHAADDGSRLVVAVNYEPNPVQARLTMAAGWAVKEVYRGELAMKGSTGRVSVNIGKNDALVFLLSR